MGFSVSVQGLKFRVQGSGLRFLGIQGLGFNGLWGLARFGVRGLDFIMYIVGFYFTLAPILKPKTPSTVIFRDAIQGFTSSMAV